MARVLLSAFLAMGVMASSLVLYGDMLEGGDASERGTEAARALSDLGRTAGLLLTAPILYLLGLPLAEAVVAGRRWLSTESLILAGTGAAIAASVWNTVQGAGAVWYESATLILVLVGLGRWMDARARERARRGLEILAPKSLPEVTRVDATGEAQVLAQEIQVGDRIRVRPGEILPVDALVLEGRAFLDQAALTGEAEPRSVRAGDRVLSGTTVLDGTLMIQAEVVGEGRVRAEIERALAKALSTKGRFVELADRISGFLLPLVLLAALCAGLLRGFAHGSEEGVRTALAVVLISCPCALGIATPLAFWTALGVAWSRGILVRGADVLERLARVRRVFFDKTGTLTDGELALERVFPHDAQAPAEHLRIAASIELGSEHPIARAFRRAHQCSQSGEGLYELEQLHLLPGIGVEGCLQGEVYRLRRAEAGDSLQDPRSSATVVILENQGAILCEFHLVSCLRPHSPGLIRELREQALDLALLTGDRHEAAERVAGELGLASHAQLLPQEKVHHIERVGKRGTLYVGDGLNDAAALAAADVGLAVAGSSPRSVEVADITLLGASIAEIAPLLALARQSVRLARLNLIWAFAYNAVGLGLAVTGRLTPVWAALAMVLSSATVVLISVRAGASQQALFASKRAPKPASVHADLSLSSVGS